jgi:hypothetical protein
VDVTAHHWDERAGQPLRFTLDESKYFAESKWIWDRLTRSDIPEATFRGSGDTIIHYPMNVEATRMRVAREEAFIEHLPAAEGAARDVPGEAEEFDAIARGRGVGGQVLLDIGRERACEIRFARDDHLTRARVLNALYPKKEVIDRGWSAG